MPSLTTAINQIDTLYSEYSHLSKFARRFYPRVLRRRFDAFSSAVKLNDDVFFIYEAADSIGFFQRLFFPSLREFFKTDTARAISYLSQSRLLKKENFNKMLAYAEPHRIVEALRAISMVRQNDFDRLMRNAAILLVPGVWNKVPAKSITPYQLERIIELAEAFQKDPVAGQAAFRHHFCHAIFLPGLMDDQALRAIERCDIANDGQHPHFASIEPSASEAAKRLKQHYGSKVRLEIRVLNALSQWLQKQPRSQSIQAAIDGLAKIRHPAYAHIDPSSGVSIQELVALLWVAIKDNTKRQGLLRNAQARMIEALGDQLTTTTAGTFNKLIKAFSGIHHDLTASMPSDKENPPPFSDKSSVNPVVASQAGFFAPHADRPVAVNEPSITPSAILY